MRGLDVLNGGFGWRGGRLGVDTPVAAFDFFKLAEFFSCAAEPHMDVLHGLAEFFSDLLRARPDSAGDCEKVGYLFFNETFR